MTPNKDFILPDGRLAGAQEKRSQQPIKISAIIPVKNDEDLIGRCLANLRESSLFYETEIIVVDGGSEDKTLMIARSLADQVFEAPESSRSSQLHWGAGRATGDLLLFLRVDTLLPQNWQAVLQKKFLNGDTNWVAGSFHMGFDRTDFPFDVIAGLANFKTHITGVPDGNQSLFVWKDAYAKSGGFPDVELLEEYMLVPRLRSLGKVQVLSEKVTACSQRYSARGPLRNAVLNSLIVFLYYLGVPPKKLSKLSR